MTDTPATELARVNRLVGPRYVVECEIGEGGASVVYRAHDRERDQPVAIKVMRPEFAAAVTEARFRREITLGHELSHPNIVPVFESGATDSAIFFTMPYLEGRSLRDRLADEPQLSLAEAMHVVRQVAAALDYAHANGVIHRDIKPGNILLSGDAVYVADFGIARPTGPAAAQKLTVTGISVGTPPYMSPEQWDGERTLDGRTDIYALGCVMYEMLGGEPPFTGRTAEAIRARHQYETPRSLRVIRPTIPYGVQVAIEHGLAKVPADRFATAGEFVEALGKDVEAPTVEKHRRWQVLLPIAGVLVVAATLGIRRAAAAADARAVANADTTRIVLLSAEHDSAAPWTGVAELALRQAIVRWKGAELVDAASVRELAGSGKLSASAARKAALQMHAGRYIQLDGSESGAARRLHLTLFDVARATQPLGESVVTLPIGNPQLDSALMRAADRLLFRPQDSLVFADTPVGTSSLPARQAYLRGWDAINHWDLTAADSAFAGAVQYDANFGRAALWLGLTRLWSGQKSPSWVASAQTAVTERNQLPAADRLRTDALAAHARGDLVAACTLWDGVAAAYPSDFTAWYGAAACLRDDKTVIADRTSPSGWRFRTGLHSAVQRYVHALTLRPAMLNALRDDAFAAVRLWLWTGSRSVRLGIADGQPEYFLAYPSWQDTLCFVPFPAKAFAADPATLNRLPRTVDDAQRHQIELFHNLAASWVAANPRSAAAEHALAVALSNLGDPAAVHHIQKAIALTTDPSERQRVVATELWMRVQLALPDNLPELVTVRRSVDSLLRASDGRVEPQMLASLAALTGQASRARALDSLLPRAPITTARTAEHAARTLLVLAAFGGPVDSLRAAEARIDSLIAVEVPAAQIADVRATLLRQAVPIAFPVHRSGSLASIASHGAPIVDAVAAFARGDTAAVHAVLGTMRSVRQTHAFPEVGIDAVYPEAWLLANTNRTREAIAWIDASLSRIRLASSLIEPIQAAVLVRLMALRAELAARVGDRAGAARWAAAVAALWSTADAFLQPTVIRMRRLAG